MTGNAWIDCAGSGAPKAAGTLVQIRRFNGDVATFHIGQGQVVAADGSVIPAGNGRWSCWNHADGGPMSVKAKAYRVIAEADALTRNAAMFNSWLNVREEELA
jgi:hypothetical protein